MNESMHERNRHKGIFHCFTCNEWINEWINTNEQINIKKKDKTFSCKEWMYEYIRTNKGDDKKSLPTIKESI